MKKHLAYIVGIMALIVLPTFFVSSTSASENIDTTVNIEPSLTLSVSANTLNLNLDPSSTTFGYNDLDVIVGTNNETGYKLTMSTTSTNLVNTADTNVVIETLPTLAGGYTDSTFTVNKWGYKKNRNTDNYNSFPLTEILLQNSTRTNEDVANLRFATKIDYLQESGTYTTNIEFNLVANPLAYQIQNLDPNLCTTSPTKVIDMRDNQEYTVQRLADGNCWLLDNLRLGSTPLVESLSTTNTNMSSSTPFTLPSSSSNFSGMTVPQINTTYANTAATTKYGDGSDKIGVLYNFCAATAGTYCDYSGAITNSYNVCPAGWDLPSGNNRNALATAYSNNIADTVIAFGAVISGYYSTNALTQQSYGYFWTNTIYDYYNNIVFKFNISTFNSDYLDRRGIGLPIRCILKES